MKYLLFILLLGLGFSQTEWSTRVYPYGIDFTTGNTEFAINMYNITGFDLSTALFQVVGMDDYTFFDQVQIDYSCDGMNVHGNSMFDHYNNELTFYSENLYLENRNCRFERANTDNNSFNRTLFLAITADFPEEDTGYIEEGFEFCLHSGANLVSYPCDNPVPIAESLPTGIENFVTSIIGEGVATEYNSTLGWIGSLSSFGEGNGYWFISNSEVCFEYDCVEN